VTLLHEHTGSFCKSDLLKEINRSLRGTVHELLKEINRSLRGTVKWVDSATGAVRYRSLRNEVSIQKTLQVIVHRGGGSYSHDGLDLREGQTVPSLAGYVAAIEHKQYAQTRGIP